MPSPSLGQQQIVRFVDLLFVLLRGESALRWSEADLAYLFYSISICILLNNTYL